MDWLDSWRFVLVVAAISVTPATTFAQQPGTPQYNNTYLPAHGVGDTRSSSRADIWGAYAVSTDNHLTGFVSRESSEGAAAQAAIDMCKERGGGNCVVEFTVVNSCSAVASGEDSNGWAIRGALEAAERAAKRSCGKSDCAVLWSACSVADVKR